jgi:peroxiredoxin
MLKMPTTTLIRPVTANFGPAMRQPAPDFVLSNHARQSEQMTHLIGERGLLLAFIGDIWNAVNVRRILWLQRHAHHILLTGFNLALISRDQPHTLYGFAISSATPPEFPLLSDVDGTVHRQFNMGKYPGMVLVDHHQIVRHKWLMPDDRVWPRIHEILETLEQI